MLQSSYTPGKDHNPSHNGFVRAVVFAYNYHQSLIIRSVDPRLSLVAHLTLPTARMMCGSPFYRNLTSSEIFTNQSWYIT
jgi:hypothetical protein